MKTEEARDRQESRQESRPEDLPLIKPVRGGRVMSIKFKHESTRDMSGSGDGMIEQSLGLAPTKLGSYLS